MSSHGFPPPASASSPHRPRRLQQPLPPIPLDVASFKPRDPKSPVRRKPLPPNAFSPPLIAKRLDYGESPIQGGGGLDSVSTPSIATDISPVAFRALDLRPHGDTPNLTPAQTNDTPHDQFLPFASVTGRESIPDSDTTAQEPSGHAEKDEANTKQDMALKPPLRPAPLRMDSTSSTRSIKVEDGRKPQTPGSKITSFFGFGGKQHASPDGSSGTDISDYGRSPDVSPHAPSPQTSAYSLRSAAAVAEPAKAKPPTSAKKMDSFGAMLPTRSQSDADADLLGRVAQLEAELKEITAELAGSIRREMDLEDEVERLQHQATTSAVTGDRTSDYFSDSGTSSTRPLGGEPKVDIERIKRESEQNRAQLRVDLSQKWQDESNRRKALESHVQTLESQISQSRRDQNQSLDVSARAKELEASLDDVRRRLAEERQTRENFEDLLTALRVDLEQYRSQRDNLRDELVPKLRSQIDGLETTLSETEKQRYEFARMQQEIQSLRDENVALHSAREMEKGINSISEDGGYNQRNSFSKGLSRSNTSNNLSRANSRAGMTRSGSMSRSNTTAKQQLDSPESFVDKLNAVELQRDALHSTVKYLLRRQAHHNREIAKKIRGLEGERDRALSDGPARKVGYERGVKSTRTEINSLRKRADDALEQKWQCEKSLGGLSLDLDRSKQETGSLRKLLQEKDSSVPDSLSPTLEQAYYQLQQDQKKARQHCSLEEEQRLADQLQASAERSEGLAAQVKLQLQTNASLRNRLRIAVESGERNQQALAAQINELQMKLRKLEDVITSAQTQSETAVLKHEEEIRLLRASHNAQLLRAKQGHKTPSLFSPTPRSPLSPLFHNAKRSPRLDKTSTGPGIALHEALKTEYLERKVAELEKALADAEKEMGEVVGRMNIAQIGVAELQSERDEAHRETRRLQAAITAEREKVQELMKASHK